MKEVMISVVVVTYNQAGTIGRTLNSILMQRCHVPFEIVIGEDCSTDNTRDICQIYAKQYPNIIRLICNERNKGIVDNYYDCLLACRGKYIADCAGDDFWTDAQKLEKEVTVMEAHPEVSMVITNWQYFDEQTRRTKPSQQQRYAPITPGQDLLKAIITQQNMSVFHLCTALYRTDIFRKTYEKDTDLFRNKTYVSEDMQIAFTMALNGDIAYLPYVTLNYSLGSGSVSNVTDSEKAFRFVSRSTELICYLANKHDLDIQDFMTQRIFELGWQVARSFKNKCLFAVMRHDWLWQAGLALRNVFVRLKQAVR